MKDNIIKLVGTLLFVLMIVLLISNRTVVTGATTEDNKKESGNSGEEVTDFTDHEITVQMGGKHQTINTRKIPYIRESGDTLEIVGEDKILDDTWLSSDSSIAKTNTAREVIGYKSGYCTITCLTESMRILYLDVKVTTVTGTVDEKNDKRIPKELRTPVAILPSIELSGTTATLLHADGMAVEWSTSDANLAKIKSSNGNKATIEVVNKDEKGGYVQIKAKLTKQADIDRVYGKKKEFEATFLVKRDKSIYKVDNRKGHDVAISEVDWSDVAIIGVVGDGGFNSGPVIQDTTDMANYDFYIVDPHNGNYKPDDTISDPAVEWAIEHYKGKKDVYLYAHSSGGYQLEHLYEELKAAGIDVKGIIVVDAMPKNGLNGIPSDVPIYIYGTTDTNEISKRTRNDGKEMARKNDNVQYGELNTTHGKAGGIGSVIPAAIKGEISTDATVTQTGKRERWRWRPEAVAAGGGGGRRRWWPEAVQPQALLHLLKFQQPLRQQHQIQRVKS